MRHSVEIEREGEHEREERKRRNSERQISENAGPLRTIEVDTKG